MLEQNVHFAGKLAPGFTDRLLKQHTKNISFLRTFRKKWGFRSGDYSGFVDHSDNFSNLDNYISNIDSELINDEPQALFGIEKTIASAIGSKIDKADKLLKILDIGGGLGVSWVKLAHHFQEQIKQDRLQFIVSNIGKVDPDLEINFERLLDSKIVDFYTQFNHLVHFVDATIPELLSGTVKINGRNIFFNERVLIAHECFSVTTHTAVPELEITLIPHLMTPDGIYFSGGEIPYIDLDPNNSRKEQRVKAISLARQSLVKDHGLNSTSTIIRDPNRSSFYTLFSHK